MNDEFPIRKIIHIDMDAFFASVEQMDFPELKGKPVAVGGSKERGVVAAASYEARKFGVKSAMASSIAARRCPSLIFMPPRFKRYKEISSQIQAIFQDYTDLIEPLSLDEAFLDVTENKVGHPSATLLAREIRYRIFDEVGLTASAGISVNKFTAKIASDINKPNGQRTIPPEEVIDFLETLPIERFFGVGKVTADKMKFHGIFNGRDLKKHSAEYLTQHFGKSGQHFYDIVRGIQYSEVKPNRERKSVGVEHTFESDLKEIHEMMEKLVQIGGELETRMNNSKTKGKTITVKLKFNDFSQQTRSRTISEYVSDQKDFMPIIKELLEQQEVELPVRLLGISVSNFYKEEVQPMQEIQGSFEF